MLNVWSQNWLRFFAPNDRIRHPLSAGFQGLKNRWLLNIGKGWKGMERWSCFALDLKDQLETLSLGRFRRASARNRCLIPPLHFHFNRTIGPWTVGPFFFCAQLSMFFGHALLVDFSSSWVSGEMYVCNAMQCNGCMYFSPPSRTLLGEFWSPKWYGPLTPPLSERHCASSLLDPVYRVSSG